MKKYVCPMGCVEPQDQLGNCPECGMKLLPTDELGFETDQFGLKTDDNGNKMNKKIRINPFKIRINPLVQVVRINPLIRIYTSLKAIFQ
jgi:hypothetical protein